MTVTAHPTARQLDPDERAVQLHGLDAIPMAGPDEARVLVRASILLSWGVAPADVVRYLATWAYAFPHLVGTAPRVHVLTEHGSRAEPTPHQPDPWEASLAMTRPPACLAYTSGPYGTGPCMRPAGHPGDCLPAPF